MNTTDADFAYGSLNNLYETSDTKALPFNSRPDSTGNTESLCFLAPPLKLNVPIPKTPKSSEKQKKIYLFGRPCLGQNQHSSQPKETAFQYLDFKSALLPSMLMSINAIANKPASNSNLTDNEVNVANTDIMNNNNTDISLQLLELAINVSESLHDGISKHQLLKTAMLLLPTEFQWYSLNQMRIHAGAPEVDSNGIEKMIFYYSQLIAMEKRFPLETNSLPLVFIWRESFDHTVQVETKCIYYEKAAILFNIAATYALMGSHQRLWAQDGKKAAASYFQKSASVFRYIKESLIQRINIQVSGLMDLSASTLAVLADLMVAQATECVFEKANDDKVSSPVTSMIATQVADCYELTLRHFINFKKQKKLPSSWIAQMKAKASLYLALAHFHAPTQQASDKTVGERIARLGLAKELVSKSLTLSQMVGGALTYSIKGHHDMIHGAYKIAYHANLERHHQVELDSRLLGALKRPQSALVNPPAMQTILGDLSRFKDIFHSMITPNHSDDIKKFLQECAQVLSVGKEDVKSSILEVEIVLGVNEKSDFLGIYNGITPNTLSNNDIENKVQHIIQKLKVYQREEQVIPSDILVASLKELLNRAENTLSQSIVELDGIHENLLQRDARKNEKVRNLRNSIIELSQRVHGLRVKKQELKNIFEIELADFSPMSWNEEKIKALMPNSISQGGFVGSVPIIKQIETLLAEKDLVMSKLTSYKEQLNKCLEDLNTFGNRTDLFEKGSSEIDYILKSRRTELKKVDETTLSARNEVKDLKQKFFAICDELEKLSFILKDTIQSKEILDSFDKSIQTFIKFREIGIIELSNCLRWKTEAELLLNDIFLLVDKKPMSSQASIFYEANGLSMLDGFNADSKINTLDSIPSEGKLTDMMDQGAYGQKTFSKEVSSTDPHLNPKLLLVQKMLVDEKIIKPNLVSENHQTDFGPQNPKVNKLDDLMEHLILKQQSEIARLSTLKKEQDTIIEKSIQEQRKHKAQVVQIGSMAYQLLQTQKSPSATNVNASNISPQKVRPSVVAGGEYYTESPLNISETNSTEEDFLMRSSVSNASKPLENRLPSKPNSKLKKASVSAQRSTSDIGETYADAPETPFPQSSSGKSFILSPEKMKKGLLKFVGLNRSRDDLDLIMYQSKPPVDPSSIQNYRQVSTSNLVPVRRSSFAATPGLDNALFVDLNNKPYKELPVPELRRIRIQQPQLVVNSVTIPSSYVDPVALVENNSFEVDSFILKQSQRPDRQVKKFLDPMAHLVRENQKLKNFISSTMIIGESKGSELATQVEQVLAMKKRQMQQREGQRGDAGSLEEDLNAADKELKPGLVNWVQEQARRVKSVRKSSESEIKIASIAASAAATAVQEMMLNNEDQEQVVSQPASPIKRKKVAGKIAKEDIVGRMDSGLGGSFNSEASEENLMRPTERTSQKRTTSSSPNKKVSRSLRDSFARLKMDNDILVQHFGSTASSSSSTHSDNSSSSPMVKKISQKK